MRYLFILMLTAMAIVVGCQETGQKQVKDNHSEPAAVSAVWESTGRADWKFIFAEDGTLSEVFREDNLHMILAEGGTGVNSGDTSAHYVYGPCVWSYDSDSRFQKVTVAIDNLHVSTQDNEVNFMIIYTFEGMVSLHGKKSEAEWTKTTKIDPSIPDQVESKGTVIFYKKK
jgi:hypothetical protein